MSAPPDPTRQTDGDDSEKCKCCGKPLRIHNFKEMKECENFNDYVEHKDD